MAGSSSEKAEAADAAPPAEDDVAEDTPGAKRTRSSSDGPAPSFMYADANSDFVWRGCKLQKDVMIGGPNKGRAKVKDLAGWGVVYPSIADVLPYDAKFIGCPGSNRPKKHAGSSKSGASSRSSLSMTGIVIMMRTFYCLLLASSTLPEDTSVKQLMACGFHLALCWVPEITCLFISFKDMFVAKRTNEDEYARRTEREKLLTKDEYGKLREGLLVQIFTWLRLSSKHDGLTPPPPAGMPPPPPRGTSRRADKAPADGTAEFDVEDLIDKGSTPEERERLREQAKATQRANASTDAALRKARMDAEANRLVTDETLKEDNIIQRLAKGIAAGMNHLTGINADSARDEGTSVGLFKYLKIRDHLRHSHLMFRYSGGNDRYTAQVNGDGHIEYKHSDETRITEALSHLDAFEYGEAHDLIATKHIKAHERAGVSESEIATIRTDMDIFKRKIQANFRAYKAEASLAMDDMMRYMIATHLNSFAWHSEFDAIVMHVSHAQLRAEFTDRAPSGPSNGGRRSTGKGAGKDGGKGGNDGKPVSIADLKNRAVFYDNDGKKSSNYPARRLMTKLKLCPFYATGGCKFTAEECKAQTGNEHKCPVCGKAHSACDHHQQK